MKALSIQQPWAWLIVNGFKNIENREWQDTNPGLRFRGPVLIHTGQKIDKDFDYEWAEKLIGQEMPRTFDLGGIVGRAEIVDVVTNSDSPWFFGKYGLVMRNAKKLPFMPLKGQLGFFEAHIPPGA